MKTGLGTLCLGLLGVLLLQGCNHFDIRTMPKSGRYMVVTRFGDKFIFDKVGFTVFNNHTQLLPDDQDLGVAFRDRIVSALSQDSAWTYVPVQVTLAKPTQRAGMPEYTYLDRISKDDEPSSAELKTIQQTAAANHIDMVVFVAESRFPDILVADSNQSIYGHGVFKRTGARPEDHAYIVYHIIMYDVASGGSIDYTSLSLKNMAEFDWPDHDMPMPDDVRQSGREALSVITPPGDIPFALCYMGLTRYTDSFDRHTRAYTCAQHYGLDSLRGIHNSLIASWLTEPQTPGREDRMP